MVDFLIDQAIKLMCINYLYKLFLKLLFNFNFLRFHTYFGLATLSLLDVKKERNLEYIEPTYALPLNILEKKYPQLNI